MLFTCQRSLVSESRFVAPPPIAFMDEPGRRAKDLQDIRRLLEGYESENQDRIFSVEVIDANLEDYKPCTDFSTRFRSPAPFQRGGETGGR
jgi:hypothetical protein